MNVDGIYSLFIHSLVACFCFIYVIIVAGWCCVISLYDTVKSRVKWDKGVNQERWGTRVIR